MKSTKAKGTNVVKRVGAIVFGALLLALWTRPAEAIRNGDLIGGTQYNGVGALLAGPGHPLCTGVLISPILVLTAAQCVLDSSPDPVFYFSLGPDRTARVTAIRAHPGFDTPDGLNLAYDVALVRLDKAAASQWSDVVPSDMRLTPVGTLAPATGVGFGETSNGLGSGIRRSGLLLMTQYIGGEGPIGNFIPDAFLEVQPGNTNRQMFCPGDTGGPLFSDGMVVGVASFRNVATCDEDGPGYYVATARLAEWIWTTAKTIENDPPYANAGPDQAIHAGQVVSLDGRASFDNNTPTESLAFAWTLATKPAASGAILSGAATAMPTFVADVPGDYVVSLTVTDADGLASAPDTVLVTSRNAPPTADAGPDQAVIVGQVVQLDGSNSRDPDADPLRFSWTLRAPVGSASVLVGANTSSPTFVPDLPGAYAADLAVSDGRGGMATDTVSVTAITAASFAEAQAATAMNAIGALPPPGVTTRGNQQALQNFLRQTIAALQAGDIAGARDKLAQAISRTDGCALRGTPDRQGAGRDWVTDCGAQLTLYAELTAALEALGP